METAKYSFRGVEFLVACEEVGSMPQHPSWFTYEDESTVRDRDWAVKEGDFVLDVGAEFGSYTVTALSQGAAFVWAWTPQGFRGRPARDYLDETLRLNGWQDRCEVLTTGIYDKDGWLNTVSQRLSPVEPEPDPNVIRVEALDSWFGRVNPSRIDWLKIDVEGAEVEVLKGAYDLISSMRPIVLVENHVFMKATLRDEVESALSALGYKHIHTIPHHGVSHSLYIYGQ